MRGAVRGEDGEIGLPLFDEVIHASDRKDAVRLTNAREPMPGHEPVNTLWLTDEAGGLVWSLRRADLPE